MNYTVATIALLIVGAIVVFEGDEEARRIRTETAELRATLATENLQQLGRRSFYCQQPAWIPNYGERGIGYCGEVWRALDARPLQGVQMTAVATTASGGHGVAN